MRAGGPAPRDNHPAASAGDGCSLRTQQRAEPDGPTGHECPAGRKFSMFHPERRRLNGRQTGRTALRRACAAVWRAVRGEEAP